MQTKPQVTSFNLSSDNKRKVDQFLMRFILDCILLELH